MTASAESSVALAAFSAAALGQQVLSLASSTLKFAASALRFQNQNQILQVSWPSLPVYTLDEVADHCTDDDCWLVIYDKVYDLTQFLNKHPGGYDVILEHAGRDATLAFRGVGHSDQGLLDMDRYLVGILPENERLYLRTPGF